MSSNVTSQATTGSLGKPGIEPPQTLSWGVCPFCTFSLRTHQKTSPYSSISLENLAAAALVSTLNEQACLSLQLATHDPASERARNHFIFIKNGTVPSCADNQNSTAQRAKLCTEHSSPGQFPRSLPWAPEASLHLNRMLAHPRMPTFDHIPRPVSQSPCYLECTLSPILPEHFQTASSTWLSPPVECATLPRSLWTFRPCQ